MLSYSSPTLQRPAAAAWARRALLVLIVALAAFIPRFAALDRFATTDEPLWVARSARFAYALQHGDFASTYQREHPGVTIMWAGAAAYWRVQPQFNGRPVLQLRPEKLADFLSLEKDASFLVILVTARRILVLVNVLILALGFVYARRLFGETPALIGFLLIALDPFHIALTRVLHLDGLLASLMLLSTLAFVGYLNTHRRVDLVVSAAAAALAWLTKSPGLFLGLVMGLLALAGLAGRVAAGDERFSATGAWRAIRPVIAWTLIAAIFFCAFWPAMWVRPLQTVTQVFSMAEQHAEEGHESAVFFNGDIIADGALGWQYAYFYPLAYLWRSTPLALVGLALAAWAWRARRWPPAPAGLAALGLLILAVGFAAFMTVGAKKFDRYLIPTFLPLDLLAGVGWSAAAAGLAAAWPGGVRRIAAGLLLPAVIAIAGLSALIVSPYYFSYYNPLLGGGPAATRVMQVGWGEGLDQAARYLLAREDAAKLRVVTFYAQGSFTYFFPGETRYLHNQAIPDAQEMENLSKADYALIYINQAQRNLAPYVLQTLAARTPEHIVAINGIEYVRIYRLRPPDGSSSP